MAQLIAEHILLPDGWHQNVLLEWDQHGMLRRVELATAAPTVTGIVLPGMTNLHSHAFQRAMAGLTEFRSGVQDSFWSWRKLMYQFAAKLTPAMLKGIARQLYIEMLQAGYTSVCEFHYLHHNHDGKPYADPAENAIALIEAAQQAGIGLTLLPVLYQYSGFGAQAPHAGQARFINSPEWIIALLMHLQKTHPQHAGLRYGAAPHSLRAVTPQSLAQLLYLLKQWDTQAPIHIHIAEQAQEVADCVAVLGQRPITWLLNHVDLSQHWCLVHTTQMNTQEAQQLSSSGVVVGLCPTTEANLGDGIFNAADYQTGLWGIGSDSHISVNLCEELRWYEYSQRLQHLQRNRLIGTDTASVGSYLYRAALHGGALASGRPVCGLQVGQRADLLVLDIQHMDLCNKYGDQWLDSFIFSHHGPSPVRDVMVGGQWVIRDRQHYLQAQSEMAYADIFKQLLY